MMNGLVMRSKVYLSKSKAGNFDDIVKCKNYCHQLGFDLTEFVGGTYNTDKLDEADYLLVLPPRLDSYPLRVGKGQHSEISKFLHDIGKNCDNILIVSNLEEGLYVDEYAIMTTLDWDWQLEYAELTTNEAQINILSYKIVQRQYVSNNYGADFDIDKSGKPMLACYKYLKKK